MSYLVDTCVLSETIRPKPNPNVIRWLETTDERGLFLSSISLGELEKGIWKVQDDTRRRRLFNWLEGKVVPAFAGRTLGVSTPVARKWGQLLGDAENVGQPLPAIDAMIASTALIAGLTVASGNARGFMRCGVRVLDPWADL